MAKHSGKKEVVDSTQFNPKLQTGRLANPVVTRAEPTCGKNNLESEQAVDSVYYKEIGGNNICIRHDTILGTKIFFKNKRNNKSEKLHTQITSGTNTVTGRSCWQLSH